MRLLPMITLACVKLTYTTSRITLIIEYENIKLVLMRKLPSIVVKGTMSTG